LLVVIGGRPPKISRHGNLERLLDLLKADARGSRKRLDRDAGQLAPPPRAGMDVDEMKGFLWRCGAL
jgi:hypothetical protein